MTASFTPLREFTDWTCCGCGADLLRIEVRMCCDERRRYDLRYDPTHDTFERFEMDSHDLPDCELTCTKCGAVLEDSQSDVIQEEL